MENGSTRFGPTNSTASIISSSPTTDVIARSIPAGPTEGDIFQSIALKSLCTVFFSMIIIKGIIGNTFVLVTLFRLPNMRTPYNLLIGNIAFADLGVCTISAPMRIIEMYVGWPFGAVISCKVLAPLQDVLVCVSVITHTAIAWERFRASVTHFKRRMKRRKVKRIIATSWVTCYLAVALVQVIFLEYRQHSTDTLYYCRFSPTRAFRRAYLMYLVVVFILAPLMVQGLCYSKVISKVRENERNLRLRSERTSETKQKRLKTRRRKHMIKMLCILTVIFQVCYLPRGIMMAIVEFSPSGSRTRSIAFVHVATMAVYYIKHVINPVILCLLCKEFRKSFKAICSCFLPQNFCPHCHD